MAKFTEKYSVGQLPSLEFVVRVKTPDDEDTLLCSCGFAEAGRVKAESIVAALEAVDEIAEEKADSTRCEGIIDIARKAQQRTR